MIDVDRVARAAGDALRAWVLEATVAGLADEGIGPAELPVIMGVMVAEGAVPAGASRWSLTRWARAVKAWVARRSVVVEKGRVSPGSRPVKATPNWLAPHELAAWRAARERAGLRIQGIEDSVRARLRTILADAIALGVSRERVVEIVNEKLVDAFPKVAKDWARVAATEAAYAYNDGVLVVAAAESPDRLVCVRVSSNACDECKKTYLDATGLPKTWRVDDLVASGKAPPRLHPRCRCACAPVSTKSARGSIA